MDRSMVRAYLKGTVVAFCYFISAQSWALPVFINELHYDNAGGDVEEGVEIAGPAGTDLSEWQLLLYDGRTGGVYKTIALTGLLADDGSGVGFAFEAAKGMQNGGADGVALIDAQGLLVQLISYEGVLTAASGPAAGLLSQDIGVEEGSSTAVGSSLQLTGTGDGYDAFTWSLGRATYGRANDGQLFRLAQQTEPEPLASVPEPGAVVLLLLGLTAWFCHPRRVRGASRLAQG